MSVIIQQRSQVIEKKKLAGPDRIFFLDLRLLTFSKEKVTNFIINCSLTSKKMNKWRQVTSDFIDLLLNANDDESGETNK